MTDPDPRHDHIYRITCTVCGDSGTLRVSIDPGAQEDTAQRVTDAFMAEEISDGHSRWQVEYFAAQPPPPASVVVEEWSQADADRMEALFVKREHGGLTPTEDTEVAGLVKGWERAAYAPPEPPLAAAGLAEAARTLAEAVLDRWSADPDDDAAKAARALQKALAAQPPAPGEPVALRCPDCQHPWSLHGPTGGCRSHTSTCGCAPPDGCMCAYNAPEPPLAAADFRLEGVSSAEWDAFEAAIADGPPVAAALDELLPTTEALLRYVEDRADPADDDFTDIHRAVIRRAAKAPLAAAGLGVDYEAMRMQRGWPTPNHMRRAADALDALTPARYGDVLRWFADLADAALAAHPEPGP